MYNAAQKKNFITSYSSKEGMRAYVQQVFEQFSAYEEEIGKDICEMSFEELQEMFSKTSRVRASSHKTPRRTVRDYAAWCREHGVAGATDAAERINEIEIDGMRQLTVRNPRHLNAFLDTLAVPETELTSDNVFRAYYWLAYAGLGAQEILTVTNDEVKLDTLTVFHDGKEYPIYREAVPSIKNCLTLQSFKYYNANYNEKWIWRDRIPSDILLRGVRAIPTLGTFRVDFLKRLRKAQAEGKTDLRLSYYRIWLSGVFYRMYEDELAGFPPDFSRFVDEKLGDFQYKVPPKGNSQEYKRKELADTYLNDYERWKETLRV